MKLMTTTAILLAVASVTAVASELLTPDKIETDIETERLREVLWNLDKIARENGGNRAFGEPGFRASVDFVLERAQKQLRAEMDTFVQPFNHTYDKTLEIKVTGPNGETVSVVSPLYNPATPLPDGITAGLVDTPVDDAAGSMCLEEQWQGVDVDGKLALIKRGVCAVADKLKLAKAHGALGVIMYNQDPGTEYATPTLGAESIGQVLPVGIIPLEVGESWKGRLAAGERLDVTLIVDAITETRETWNVFVETKSGDPDKVVMLGAHLDSVQKGAGINDDGSGVAALLEIMGSVKKYDGFPHKIRFAFWGAEESGLVGSLYYTSQLSEAEVDKIKYYFNYDMIGSPNPIFAIARDENSGIGPQLLEAYLASQGKNVSFGGFGSGSDFVGFLQLGIPTAAIFTGAGDPWDPCYHQACDNFSNVHWEALTTNAKAAARAMAILAHSLEGVPPRQTTSPNLRSRSRIAPSFRRWATLAEEAGRGHMCSHKAKKRFA